jgi:hypothetical protein
MKRMIFAERNKDVATVKKTMSATGMPSAPCFKMNALWASENFDAFIALRSLPASDHRLFEDRVSFFQFEHDAAGAESQKT